LRKSERFSVKSIHLERLLAMTKQLRGVLLDVDGTLIDSNDAQAQSWVQALKEQGFPVSFDQVRPLIGMGGDKVLPQTVGLQKESQQGQQISKRRKALFLSHYLPTLRAFPQAWELLQHLREQGFALIAASSAEPDELEDLLKLVHPQAPMLFTKKTSAEDAGRSKPNPDVIQAALQQGDLQSEETLMLGDTAYDIEAAAQAGVKTIAFRCGGWSDQDLQGAIALYDGPADLLAHYRESPLAQGRAAKQKTHL
jgi:HAD superfamily hydrolase (TIGR01509 family)